MNLQVLFGRKLRRAWARDRIRAQRSRNLQLPNLPPEHIDRIKRAFETAYSKPISCDSITLLDT